MNTITLDKRAIERLFEDFDHQQLILIEIYKMAIPDWEDVRKLLGWPAVNKSTWCKIHSLFSDFDRKYHPKCMPGGAWFNSGFSLDENLGLKDWEVQPIEPEKIIYKGQRNRVTGISVLNFQSQEEPKKCVRFHRLISDSKSHYRITHASYGRLAACLKSNGNLQSKGYWTIKDIGQ